MNGWRDVAIDEGGKQIDMAALGSVDEGHQMRGKFSNQFDHMYDSFPDHLSGGSLADALPAQPVVVEEPMSDPPPPVTTQEPLPQPPVAQPIDFGDLSQFNPFPSGRTFTMSDDDPMGVIATIMERVQMHDAGGSLLVKYDPMDNYDMHKLGQNVGMSSIDVRAIAMSLGDWGVIAKSFNTTHDVVRAIKRSCGGALNG